MTDLNIKRIMSFDHGIDTIVKSSSADTPSLPERRNLSPSDGGVRNQLAQLLEKNNTAQFLEQALRPNIANRAMLLPAQFEKNLRELQQRLAKQAEAAGADSRTLNRAVRLLKEETRLRELVGMYRNTLYQG